MTVAYIALGSNIDPEKNLRDSVARLRDISTVLRVSSVYQTPPFGYIHQPDFLDVTVKVETDAAPADFKHLLYAIEHASGRVREKQLTRWGPLELDLDILLWGNLALEFGSKPWRVPNEGILRYAAVAAPLAEIAPDERHPITGETFAVIAERLGRSGFTVRDDLKFEPGPVNSG